MGRSPSQIFRSYCAPLVVTTLPASRLVIPSLYNQKKKKENVEIFLFIMVMAVFAAVLGVMSLGEKMQPVNQIRKISSGWYYYENGKRTEVTLPDTIQAEEGEELILYNDGITDLDAGKVVTTRGAQYDLKIWLGDRPI